MCEASVIQVPASTQPHNWKTLEPGVDYVTFGNVAAGSGSEAKSGNPSLFTKLASNLPKAAKPALLFKNSSFSKSHHVASLI